MVVPLRFKPDTSHIQVWTLSLAEQLDERASHSELSNPSHYAKASIQ
jgi:hypothetical protein